MSADFLPGHGTLNGRRFAANQLLRQWGEMAGDHPVELLGVDPIQLDAYRRELSLGGHAGSVTAIPFTDPRPIATNGALFTPDPALGLWSRWRWPLGPASFSIIGQTHTLASTAAIAHLDALGSDPLGPWDALICSSTAGAVVAQHLLDARLEQLQHRFGFDLPNAQSQSPQLPVIPLPIDVAGLQAALPERAEARQKLGISNDSAVLLWIGRLSMLTKLDPWPQYQMLDRLAQQLDQPLLLVELGPDDTQQQAEHLCELRAHCPHVQFLQLGGQQPATEEQKYAALAAADLALSLVDNVQETFGLAIAEAMAAGLPVVASDWDGYRDSVRDGIDGFLVPTHWASCAEGASPGLGWLHQLGVIPYTAFAGALAQLVDVDMEAAAAAIGLLLQDPLVRRRMGEAAARRAEQRFERSLISRQYLELFAVLSEQRQRARQDGFSAESKRPSSWRMIDPVRLFESFATGTAEPAAHDVVPPPIVRQGRRGIWEFLRMASPREDHGQLQRDLFAKHR